MQSNQIVFPGPLFIKQTNVLPQDLVKSRSLAICVSTISIALKFHRQIGHSACDMPVKFHSDTIIITRNMRLRDFKI